MTYGNESLEGRFLRGEPDTVGLVIHWIALVLATPRFWPLRADWLDLQQETLLQVLESLRRRHFDPSRDLRVYVQAVARYTALDALSARAQNVQGRVPLRALPDGAPRADETLASVLFARVVLDQASEDCRALIKAYFLEQQNYEEIARRMGVPVGTVKSRLARCLEKCHRTFGGRRVGRPPVEAK